MLKIRLQRVGRKHEPSFRLVLTESKNSTKSGRFKEVLGSYDPRKTIEAFKSDRIQHWMSQGAQITESVNNLLVKKGILRGKKIHVGSDYVAKAPVVEENAESPKEALAPEAPATESPDTTPEEAKAPEAPAENQEVVQ